MQFKIWKKADIFIIKKKMGGEYFFDSLISDLESLQFYAGIHSKKFDFYRTLSKRFPFAIYYEIKKDIVMVVAILDMRRAPAWIREKLKKVKS